MLKHVRPLIRLRLLRPLSPNTQLQLHIYRRARTSSWCSEGDRTDEYEEVSRTRASLSAIYSSLFPEHPPVTLLAGC